MFNTVKINEKTFEIGQPFSIKINEEKHWVYKIEDEEQSLNVPYEIIANERLKEAIDNKELTKIFIFIDQGDFNKDDGSKGFIYVKYKGKIFYKEKKFNNKKISQNGIELLNYFLEILKGKIKVYLETNVKSNDLKNIVKQNSNIEIKFYNDFKVGFNFLNKVTYEKTGGFYNDEWQQSKYLHN